MMVTHEIQDGFDTLDLWFEPCPVRFLRSSEPMRFY